MGALARSVILASLIAAATGPALAQSSASPTRPSFDGVWTNASATRLERPANFKVLVVPEAEADDIVKTVDRAQQRLQRADRSQLRRLQGRQQPGRLQRLLDRPRRRPDEVRGEARSSHIIARRRQDPVSATARRVSALPIREGIEYRSGEGDYEGPEDLPLRERCLIAQSDGGGPVMLNGLYNNNYEFHLTSNYLVILVEMVHDARIIPIYASADQARAAHKPAVIKPWLGDSVAWWDGDTLVSETRNVNPIQSSRTQTPLSPEGTVTERFTRIDADELLYQFRVDDPVHYTTDWSGEYAFKPGKGNVYEYACHEGNYAMDGILGGARLKEAAAAAPTSGKR